MNANSLTQATYEIGALIERAHETGCGHAARTAADHMRSTLELDGSAQAEVARRVVGIDASAWYALLSAPRATPASRARLRALRSKGARS